MFLFRAWRKIKILTRFNLILLAFFSAGFSGWISYLKLQSCLPFTHQIASGGKNKSGELPRKLREVFIKLGPVFVKFGQILSTRNDILPPEYIRELEKLQTKVPPFSFSIAKKTIERALGKKLEDLFDGFQTEPFASASLGQVYEARLKSGQPVAVKVQRPGAKKQIMLDTEVLIMAAGWADKHIELARNLNLTGLVREFRRWTLNELDYRKEATNCEIFSNFFKDDSDIFGPKVYWDYTADCVLTLELIQGVSLGDLISGNQKQHQNKKRLAHIIADSFVRQFFEYGFFHADPHPGNIFILKNGHVTFLDFGMVGFLDERLTGLASTMFVALLQKDIETLVSLLIKLEENYDETTGRRPVNAAGLRKELNQLVLQWPESGQAGKFTNLLAAILDTAVKNGINVPTDLSMLAKSIITLDVVVKQLDQNFQMEKWEEPMVTKIINKKLEGKNIKSAIKTSAFVLEDLLKRLPESTASVVERLQQGRFGMEISGAQLLEYEKLINANSKINTYGLLLAAVIVASALIYQAKGQPELFGLSVAQIALYGSLLLIVKFLFQNINGNKK